MSHRRKESDPTECKHNEIHNILALIHVHTRLSVVKFQQFWYYTDRPTKMTLTKNFLRTKQMLIIITSFLFVFGMIWFGSHPEVRPLIPEKHKYISMRVVPSRPFPAHSELIRRLGLEPDRANASTLDLQHFFNLPWEVHLPSWANSGAPAIITALFTDDDFERSLKLIYSGQQFANDTHLVMFDMTPTRKSTGSNDSPDDLRNYQTVETFCNLTQTCSIHKVPFLESWVPKYIHKKDYGAYKPILIQKILRDFPMILWMDLDGLIPTHGLEGVWDSTRKYGVVTWELLNRCSTSSYTFKKMLPYFSLTANDLNFKHMFESGSYAFKQTAEVDQILRLWLNCSLTEDCIKPIGCDPRYCDDSTCQNKQPRFEYMRCHKYETSALSVSLVKLQYQNRDADRRDYPVAESSKVADAELAYNTTAIKTYIVLEKIRLERLRHPKRRTINFV